MTFENEETTGLGHYLAQLVEMRGSMWADHGGPPAGYAYTCLEDFVLQHGQRWEIGPRPKGIRKRAPKMCFANTYKLVDSAQGQALGLRYVEGYARGVIATHHAWAVTPEDIVVDTTWTSEMGTDYYGVEFPIEVVNAAILLSGVFGVLDDWRNGHELLRAPYEPEDAKRRLTDAYIKRLERSRR